MKQKLFLYLRFSGGAIFGILVYVGLFYVLVQMGLWYVLSAIAAGSVQTAVKFVIYKHWVFRNRSQEFIARQMAQFTAMALSFLVVNPASLIVLVEYVGLGTLVAQSLIIPVLGIVSFVLSKRIFAN